MLLLGQKYDGCDPSPTSNICGDALACRNILLLKIGEVFLKNVNDGMIILLKKLGVKHQAHEAPETTPKKNV